MKKAFLILLLLLPLLLLLGATGKVLNGGKFYEMRDSTFILWTSRIHSDSTLDTIALINKDGIWISYGEFSDSLWAKIFRGEYGVLDSALIAKLKADTLGAYADTTITNALRDSLGAYLDTTQLPDSSWVSITATSADIDTFTDDVVFDSTVTFLGTKQHTFIAWMNSNNPSYDLTSNATDGTYNEQYNVYPYTFNAAYGDSFILDSVKIGVTWSWDGTPDNTDTLIWQRTCTLIYQAFLWDNDSCASGYVVIRDAVNDTIIGDRGNGDTVYIIPLGEKYNTHESFIKSTGFDQIIVDVNSATSVDWQILAHKFYIRQW